jgi:hypothetical protein
MEGLGIRCVSDEPWITAARPPSAPSHHTAIGDVSTATDLLRGHARIAATTASYDTGIVYPSRRDLPPHETSAYTGRR